MGGGYFQFFTKNRPQKHQKRAILHTSQANGEARAPPPPLATLLLASMNDKIKVLHTQIKQHDKNRLHRSDF